MFITSKKMKKMLDSGSSIKKCIATWKIGIGEIIECIEYNYYEEDYNNSDELINIDNITYLTKDIVKTLRLLKNKTNKHKNDPEILSIISKIITRHLYVKDVILSEKVLLSFLNFIHWNCSLLFQHAEDWAADAEEAGCDIITLIELAEKYEKNITGYTTDNAVYALLMAVYCFYNDKAEKFIIDKNIKLSKKMCGSKKAMIIEMINFFRNKKKYNLIPDE